MIITICNDLDSDRTSNSIHLVCLAIADCCRNDVFFLYVEYILKICLNLLDLVIPVGLRDISQI